MPDQKPRSAATDDTAKLAPSSAARQARGRGADGPPARIVIQYPQPTVDGGAFPTKRVVGDRVDVSVDVFRDGHDLLRSVVKYRPPGSRRWREAELRRIDDHLGGVRWAGSFEVDRTGGWSFTFEAWTDRFGTWRDELERKVAAGQHDLVGELMEGVALLHRAIDRARTKRDLDLLEQTLATVEDERVSEATKHQTLLSEDVYTAIEREQEREGAVSLEPLALEVDRLQSAVLDVVRAVPTLVGRAEGRRGPAPEARRARVRRDLPATDPSDRADQSQGPRQRASQPRRAIPARPGRSATAAAATTRSMPTSGRSPTSAR